MRRTYRGETKRYARAPYVLILASEEFELVEEFVTQKAKEGDYIAVQMLDACEAARAERTKAISELND